MRYVAGGLGVCGLCLGSLWPVFGEFAGHVWVAGGGRTCRRWLPRRRCGRCCGARADRWPAGCRPSPRWSGARRTRSGARSSLGQEPEQRRLSLGPPRTAPPKLTSTPPHPRANGSASFPGTPHTVPQHSHQPHLILGLRAHTFTQRAEA